mgnify:CR=1 FL=1
MNEISFETIQKNSKEMKEIRAINLIHVTFHFCIVNTRVIDTRQRFEWSFQILSFVHARAFAALPRIL